MYEYTLRVFTMVGQRSEILNRPVLVCKYISSDFNEILSKIEYEKERNGHRIFRVDTKPQIQIGQHVNKKDPMIIDIAFTKDV